MKIKCRLALAASLIPLWAMPASALPKEPDYLCYMVNAAGRVISLSGICPQAPLTESSAGGKTSAQALTQKEKNIFVSLYSDRYCEGRKRMMTNEQASTFAGEVVSTFVVNIRGTDGSKSLDDATISQALREKTTLCPQFKDD